MTRLLVDVLKEGIDDWVPLGAIDGLARRHVGERTDLRRAAVEDVVCELLRSGLAEVGSVDEESGFVAWEVPIDAALEHVSDLLKRDDPGLWWFDAWVRLTEIGQRVVDGEVGL
jgi:hypothetical protein